MNEVVAGLSDAASGTLVASAVEPDTGNAAIRAVGHTGERACLNCRTPLTGDYCHSCGQRAHVHRTLGSLVHDLAHGVFHFEGKIWRTLPMLAWRPGEVTRRYIAGERARFVSPLALFLFSVFLLATILGNLPSIDAVNGLRDGLSGSNRSLGKVMQENEAKLVEAVARREAAIRSGQPTTDADASIASLRDDQKNLRAIRDNEPSDLVADVNVSSKLEFINARWKQAKDNPELLIYKLKTSAYKFSWVLVPMSLPFLWLLFPFSRRFGMYDHAIFAIYSLASISLLTIVLAVLAQVPAIGGSAGTAFLVLVPIHMYRQLRGAYSLGRISALLRTALLLMIATFVLIGWIIFLMLVGAA